MRSSIVALAIVIFFAWPARQTASIAPLGAVAFGFSVQQLAAALAVAGIALEGIGRARGARAAAVAKADEVWDSSSRMTEAEFGFGPLPMDGGVFRTEVKADAHALSPSANEISVLAESRRDTLVYNGSITFPVVAFVNDAGGIFAMGFVRNGILGRIESKRKQRGGAVLTTFPSSLRASLDYDLSQLQLMYLTAGVGMQAHINSRIWLEDPVTRRELWSADIFKVRVTLQGPEVEYLTVDGGLDLGSFDKEMSWQGDGIAVIGLNEPVRGGTFVDIPLEPGALLGLEHHVRLSTIQIN